MNFIYNIFLIMLNNKTIKTKTIWIKIWPMTHFTQGIQNNIFILSHIFKFNYLDI